MSNNTVVGLAAVAVVLWSTNACNIIKAVSPKPDENLDNTNTDRSSGTLSEQTAMQAFFEQYTAGARNS